MEREYSTMVQTAEGARSKLIIKIPSLGLFSLLGFVSKEELVRDSRESKKRVIALIARASKEEGPKTFEVMAGALSPDFYDGAEVIQRCEELILQKGKIYIAFHGDPDVKGRDDALKNLKERNSKLVALALKYPEGLSLYWASVMPKQHYGIANKKHLFFQEPDEPKSPRWEYFKYKDSKLGEEWSTRFQDYIKRTSSITAKDLL